MTDYLVLDWMTPHPITITPQTTFHTHLFKKWLGVQRANHPATRVCVASRAEQPVPPLLCDW